MVTRFRSGAVDGIDGIIVSVEVDVSRGLPGFQIVGLPNAAVRESRERVLAALRNSGYTFPLGKVTVNLAPADIRKEGASFDLAIALGLLAAQGRGGGGEATRARGRALILGELSLFGELRPVRGLLPIVLCAVARGETVVVVPAVQVPEARLVAGVRVVGVRDLSEAVAWWAEGRQPAPLPACAAAGAEAVDGDHDACLAFRGFRGQAVARRAAVVAAAGRHNLLLVGPPGTGKTRLACALPGLQPALAEDEALEVTRIHSAACLLRRPRLMRRRPFRAPHHTTTRAGLIGGGAEARPGEATLAHRGILFLDELAEFAPAALDALRQPLEEGCISLVRRGVHRVYPADFQLVAAMNPCRCGHHGSRRRACTCSAADRRRYLQRLSGPLLDRFDLFVEMSAALEPALQGGRGRRQAERSGEAAAADWSRLRGVIAAGWRRLGPGPAGRAALRDSPEAHLAALGLGDAALEVLERARRRLGLSLRAVLRTGRVARTVAALAGRDGVLPADVAEALAYRREGLPLLAGEAQL